MAALRLLLILVAFAVPSAGKFRETYKGIAADGVQACINNSNFTRESLILRQNCREGFKCVMENIPNYGQSILSSGSAILGFIPTVLLVMGNTNGEILRISARFPVLALLLSITNINKRPDREQQGYVVSNGRSVPLGPYGSVGILKSSASSSAVNTARWIGVWAVHIVAGVGAALVIWQAVDMGKKGVVTWACWTEWYPILWICTGVLHHLLAVVCMRLSLQTCRSATKISPAPPQATSRRSASNVPPPKHRSALLVWDLTQDGLEVEVKRQKWARWTKAVVDLLNNINYLYGTAIFSSLTLITGRVAIEKLAYFGIVAVVSRIAAAWVLEEMEESK